MAESQSKRASFYDVKRCPYCSTELPVYSRECTSCKKKVGDIDRHGRAKEPFDWKAYTLCVLSWLFFAFFIWWGFFREKS